MRGMGALPQKIEVGLALIYCLIFISIVDPAFAVSEERTRVQAPFFVAETKISETGTSLRLSEDAYATLREYDTVRLSEFPISKNDTVDLELTRFSITTPSVRIVTGGADGDVPVSPPEIVLFRGRVVEWAGSHVVLGISPRGCHGVIWMGEDGYVITPKDRTEKVAAGEIHVIHKLSELPAPVFDPNTECGVKTPLTRRPDITDAALFKALRGPARVALLALECDYEYWDKFNHLGRALDYIYLLFALCTDIFERDLNVKVALSFIRIWTTPSDPYSYVGGGADGLHEFQDYWRANHSTPGNPGYVKRDLAHLLSARGVGAWANLGQLCKEYGYSISGGAVSGATQADSLLHDVIYGFHEIGHVFGGIHTHCFDPPVDKCHNTESGCWNGSRICQVSTLMSYCKNCAPDYGNNVLHAFCDENVAVMLNNTTCLGLARNPCYVDWRNTSTEDGTTTAPYNTVKEGSEGVLPGGTVSIADGNYPEPMTIWQPMTLKATGGTVVIGE